MITISENATAQRADRAICLPKLDETFFTPGESALMLVLSAASRRSCCGLVSFLSLIWKFLYSSPFWDCPRPCTTASFSCPIRAACARTLSIGVKFAVLNVIWTPPLKSMPRFRPRVASEMTLMRMTTPEIANQRLRRRM